MKGSPRNVLKKPVPGTLRSRVPAPNGACGQPVHAEVRPGKPPVPRPTASRVGCKGMPGGPGRLARWPGGGGQQRPAQLPPLPRPGALRPGGQVGIQGRHGGRGERDLRLPGALTDHPQHSVAAIPAQVGDVGGAGLIHVSMDGRHLHRVRAQTDPRHPARQPARPRRAVGQPDRHSTRDGLH